MHSLCLSSGRSHPGVSYKNRNWLPLNLTSTRNRRSMTAMLKVVMVAVVALALFSQPTCCCASITTGMTHTAANEGCCDQTDRPATPPCGQLHCLTADTGAHEHLDIRKLTMPGATVSAPGPALSTVWYFTPAPAQGGSPIASGAHERPWPAIEPLEAYCRLLI